MLTEKERKWLEERKHRKAPCGDETHHCVGCMVKYGCSLTPDWIDAAEFEARVAVVAANGAQPCLQYDYDCPYGYAGDCPDNCDGDYNRFGTQATRCGLKHARLYVEEEMENDSTGMA
mgnify:CR=1 FL=1